MNVNLNFVLVYLPAILHIKKPALILDMKRINLNRRRCLCVVTVMAG